MASGRGAFSLDVKGVILARDLARCDRCGFRVTSGHFHHRHPREMGGTRKPWIGLPSNGLLLHPACHDWVEEHRAVALELGLLVQSGQRPAEVPVYRWNGWHRLFDDGSMQKVTAPPSLTANVEVDSSIQTGTHPAGKGRRPGAKPVPVRPVVDARDWDVTLAGDEISGE